MTRGMVCFVGMGPGEPRLRTERAADRLASADLIVHDDDRTPVDRLVELARDGKRVVRAVMGDPFESAAAISEARDLAGAGVPFEVVPGVGARAAAASFGGLLGRAAWVGPDDIDQAVSGAAQGADVTVIVSAGSPTQEVLPTTAAAAPALVRGLGARVVLSFGAPEGALRWYERLPLFGKCVLVTRAREQADSAAGLLREHGAKALVVPTIEIRPPADPAPLDRALAGLRAGVYAWAAFTSANGVERMWESLLAAGADARAFGATKVAAIGPATARALESHGLRPDVVAKEFVGERLAADMVAALQGAPHGPSPRVLLARAARARDVLPEALRAAGCVVDVVAAYETHAPSPETVAALTRELERGAVDAVTFTSSSTVENLCALLGGRAAELLARTRVASIGPITTETARSRGLRVDVTALEYTVPGLVRALAASYEGRP